LAVSKLILKVKVIGESLQSSEENIARVVGVTLTEGFLVLQIRLTAMSQ